jgi:hypothetical protein
MENTDVREVGFHPPICKVVSLMLVPLSDRLDSEEDDVEIDPGRPLNEAIRDCLKEVTSKAGKVRKARKLSYLVSSP